MRLLVGTSYIPILNLCGGRFLATLMAGMGTAQKLADVRFGEANSQG